MFTSPSSIEDTWREWQKWNNDLEKFTDWLKDCQRKVKYPKVEGTFVVLKHEQAVFEVHENNNALIYDSFAKTRISPHVYIQLAS